MQLVEDIPVTYFRIDRDYNINQRSFQSNTVFPAAGSLLELVDQESLPKARKFIQPELPESRLELNMKTKEKPISLYDVRVSWMTPDTGVVVCLELDDKIQGAVSALHELKRRLSETDISLFAAKEELELELSNMKESAVQEDVHAMLGKLAAGVAHEIRNPLTSIRGFVQLLKPYLSDLGKGEYVQILLSEIDRASEIINEFLVSSKPEKQAVHQVAAATLLREIVLLCQSEATLKGCVIELDSLEPNLFLNVNPKEIKQVLLNMIQNAFDAIQESVNRNRGRVRIHAKKNENSVIIAVSDNGKGMEPAVSAKVFEPFFTTKSHGTGLGMSVCRRIIEERGGRIEVESRTGVGSTFSIMLPLSLR